MSKKSTTAQPAQPAQSAKPSQPSRAALEAELKSLSATIDSKAGLLLDKSASESFSDSKRIVSYTRRGSITSQYVIFQPCAHDSRERWIKKWHVIGFRNVGNGAVEIHCEASVLYCRGIDTQYMTDVLSAEEYQDLGRQQEQRNQLEAKLVAFDAEQTKSTS